MGLTILMGHDPRPSTPQEITIRQKRVQRALDRVQRRTRDALDAFNAACQLAHEEGLPVNAHISERIVESLVDADCLLRTESALRDPRVTLTPKSGGGAT